MQRDNDQGARTNEKGRAVAAVRAAFSRQVLHWAMRVWRSAGSVIAVGLALLLTWHVVNGKHGLSFWQQKRVEDRQLRREIEDLQQENANLRQRNEKLKSDPHAIEREARENLHYAKPGEVIIALPPDPPAQTHPAAK
jgi:cell division protein FtsB